MRTITAMMTIMINKLKTMRNKIVIQKIATTMKIMNLKKKTIMTLRVKKTVTKVAVFRFRITEQLNLKLKIKFQQYAFLLMIN